jgi:NAD(P)-dependent dehydrogenase (short-subunit alcohol dehydrogenase family)
MEGWTAYCTSKAGVHMLTRMLALELGPRGIASHFVGIPPTDTAMQAEIRAAGLNPISRIPQDKLVPTAVPASVLAYMCSAQARAIDEVLLDVRQDRFTAMMDLPAPEAG